jgi:transcriptional antiterminator RfaH
MMGNSWYLVHTKVRQERLALENLERQGFECFLPLIRAERLNRGSLQVVQEPLFTGYLFIRLSNNIESQSWAPIRSTVGVSRMVTFGQKPMKIDPDLIGDLRVKTDCAEVQLRALESGAQAIVTDEPFEGVKTIYQVADAEGRVMMLLNILCQQVKKAVASTSIRKLS